MVAEQKVTPIAIIGLSCRFPGGANNQEELWELLSEGRSGWSEVPADRWNWKSFYHPNPEFSGAHNHRGGHFLDQDISRFDAGFFGIPPTEAKAIDPQQRIQLEVAYEALENAGIPLESIRGSKTSVYVAVFSHDYDRMVYKDVADIPQYHTTGTGAAITSNRISYLLDLKGPSMTIDTGCSGSLVALHQACQSLRLGESDMALVGGTNLILGPDQMVAMSMISLLNDDGKSYAFDARGSGYGRGEGVATVVLKRLDDALLNSDPIRAVIRNTGVNQDGKTAAGITSPNQESQAMLIRSVYKAAMLDPLETTYVEAHGTGTVAGDSAEVRALADVFCHNGERPDYLYIGSIKANIGHLESSSGIAGLIKTVLALERGLIPPNINLNTVKEDLTIDDWKIKVPRKVERWQPAGIRRASLNSFGYGGTNAHAILEASSHKLYSELMPKQQQSLKPARPTKYLLRKRSSFENLGQALPLGGSPLLVNKSKRSPQIFVLTARSKTSLLQSIKNFKQWLASGQEDSSYLRDLAYTLSSRRSLMQWRTSIVATSYRELVSLVGHDPPVTKIAAEFSVNFVFTGQGAQWHAMGRDLIFSQTAFHTSLSKADDILKRLGSPWSIIEELMQTEAHSRIGQSEIAQPITTAIQLALVDMLKSLGVTPTAVVGHSSGEIAAAYTAGFLSQEMALRVSYFRGFIANAVNKIVGGKGAMIAVGTGEKQVLPYISRVKQGVISVACVNSPSSVTVSGDEAGIMELQEILNDADIFNRRLKVDTAYHSHHMHRVANQYLATLEGLQVEEPTDSVKFFSSVTGTEKTTGFGPFYWVANLVSQVKFSEALTKLSVWQSSSSRKSANSHHLILVEVGPHSALAGPVRQIMGAMADEFIKSLYVSCLVRDKNAKNTMLDVVSKCFNQGAAVNLSAANSLDRLAKLPNIVTALPPYPWDHSTSYWHESRLSKEYRLRRHPHHDLLGTKITSSTAIEPCWRHLLSLSDLPWLREHMIDGSIIFPGSAFLCMAIKAIHQVIQDREITKHIHKFVLKDVSWIKALIIPESSAKVEVQVCLRLPTSSTDSTLSLAEDFQISSLGQDGTWNVHCRGSVAAEYMPPADDIEALHEQELSNVAFNDKFSTMSTSCTQKVDPEDLYNEMRSNGHAYGPHFATISDFHLGSNQAFGKVTIPDIAELMPFGFSQPHVLHPATLDTLIHSALPLFYRQHVPASIMPIALRELSVCADIVCRPGQDLIFGTTLVPKGTRSSSAEVVVFYQYPGAQQKPVLVISGLELFGIGESVIPESPFNRRLSYKIEWKEDTDFISISPSTPSESTANTQLMTPGSNLVALDRPASTYIDKWLMPIPNDKMNAQHHIDHWKWMKKFHDSDIGKKVVEALNTTNAGQQINQENPVTDIDSALLSQIGPNLAPILRAEIMHDQSTVDDDVSSFLNTPDDSMLRCYDALSQYLDLLAFKHPKLVILELGARSSGATSSILHSLSRNREILPLERYDYTNPFPNLFEQAENQLSEWKHVLQFQVLNIESDPIEQGFAQGSYDVIIAANILHSSSNIQDTLINIRKLLKPKGKLLLIELTKFTVFNNTTFGISENWLAGANAEQRDAPVISADQESTALVATSPAGITVPAKDYESGADQGALMVARAGEQKTNLPSVSIISGTNPVLALGLAQKLGQLGFATKVTPWNSESVSKDCIYVILDEDEKPILSEPSAPLFSQIVNYVSQATKLLWISVSPVSPDIPNPLNELVAGFSRAARAENDELKFVTLSAYLDDRNNYTDIIDKISLILSTSFGDDLESELEFRYVNGKLLIPRIIPDEAVNLRISATAGRAEEISNPFIQKDRPLKLQIEKRAFFENMVFIDDTAPNEELGEDDVEISAVAWGVSTKEIKASLGQLKTESVTVRECAGTVTAVGSNIKQSFRVGDRVCAWNTTLSTRPRARGYNTYRLPDEMSFSEGASIPVAFATAYYALEYLGNLQERQKVLIHHGARPIGQAAIMIARYIRAEIFVTAESAEKREFLIKSLQIPRNHVFSSKTPTFKKAIMRLTNGQGVDVVLNSLTEGYLLETWECVARFGTFIEIGSADAVIRSADRNITLVSVDMAAMARNHPKKVGTVFQSAMSMFDTIAPPPIQSITRFSLSAIDEAFRLVQSRKNIGKVVLEADINTLVSVISAKPPELSLNRESSYIVVGGLGYIGQHICRFMASHGATNIIIPTRRKLSLIDFEDLKQEIGELGSKLHILEADINNLTQVQELVSRCKKEFPPIKGVVQGAVSYQDRLLEQMTLEEFQGALEPKVNGTLNLSNALSELDMDFFVMLSSVVSVLGNKAQANYAAGNSFQDGFAHSKSGSKTHYFSLNLGLVVGGSDAAGTANLIRQGCIPLELEHLDISLNYIMSGQARKDDCNQLILGFDRRSISSQEGNLLLRNPLFNHLPDMEQKITQDSHVGSLSIEDAIAAASTLGEARAIIAGAIAKRFSTLVAMDVNDLDFESQLSDFGLDSLIAIELRNWITRRFDMVLQTAEIFDSFNILVLTGLVCERSALITSKFPPPVQVEEKE